MDKDIREFEKVEDLHEKASQHAALREFLGNLHESQAKLARRLQPHPETRVFKNRGLGRIYLQRALEASGLNKDQEFSMQSSFDGKRPDAIIHLPGNRQLIIDAKVSLTAYEKSISSETKDRKKRPQGTSSPVRKHIDELSARLFLHRG